MDAALLAQADFDQALRLTPADGAAHNGLALARLKLGRFKDAADSAEQALKLGPAERTAAQQCSHVLDAARVFAQLSLKAAEEAGANSQRGKDVGLAYQNRAIGLVRDAVMALPAPERKKVWSATIERDRAWNPIRECKGFLELAGQVGQAEPHRRSPLPRRERGENLRTDPARSGSRGSTAAVASIRNAIPVPGRAGKSCKRAASCTARRDVRATAVPGWASNCGDSSSEGSSSNGPGSHPGTVPERGLCRDCTGQVPVPGPQWRDMIRGMIRCPPDSEARQFSQQLQHTR